MRSLLGRFHRPMSRGAMGDMLTMNSLGDGSTLSLDFTAMGDVLDPRLTFSRASTATFVNSQGYVEYAGANLLLQSETMSTSPWVDQNGASRLQVSVTNPIGGTTCTQVTSGTASNAISQGPTYEAGMPHVIRIWVRAGTSSQLQLGVYAGAGFVTGSISVVSGTATISGTGLFLATGLTSTWTQLQIVYTSLTGSGAFLIYPDTASPVAGRTIYVWGAQLNPGSTAQTYYPTTTAAYYAPRFDYSPTNIGEPRGLLVEGNTQNFITQSQALSGYSPYGMIAISIDGTITDPMGGNEAKKIAASTSATSVFHGFLRNATNAGTATTVTISMFAKKNNYKYLYFYDGSTNTAAVRFNLDTGVTDGNLGTGYVSAKMTPYRNGWYRCEMTANIPASANRSWGFSPAPDSGATYSVTGVNYIGTGNSNDGIYAIGWQVEAGSGASSYIPTGASAVTRNADSCVMTGTNFSSWFAGATEGVLFAQYEKQRSQSGSTAHDFCAVGSRYNTGEGLILYHSNTNFYPTALLWPTGGAVFGGGIATAIPSVTKQAAKWFGDNDVTNYSNGTIGTTGTGTGTVTPAMLSFGANSSTGTEATRDWLNSCIRKVKFYPTALSDAAIQALTTP